jgi:hypothetical protein
MNLLKPPMFLVNALLPLVACVTPSAILPCNISDSDKPSNIACCNLAPVSLLIFPSSTSFLIDL